METIVDVAGNKLHVGDKVWMVDWMNNSTARPDLVEDTIVSITGKKRRQIHFTDEYRTVIAFYDEKEDWFQTNKCIRIK